MNKVKLTQEQARAIEWALNESDVYKNAPELLVQNHGYSGHTGKEFADGLEALNSLNTLDLAKALLVGYEVEPEYKVGDWIKSKLGKGIGKIIDIDDTWYWTDFGLAVPKEDDVIRYATDEEIKKEKERRWWAKHGRKVWELKVGDVLTFKESPEVYNVHRIDRRFVKLNSSQYTIEQIKNTFRIACFAEQRLDKGDKQ